MAGRHHFPIIFALLAVVSAVCGCQNSRIHRRLVLADSIMRSGNLDSAYTLLNRMDTARQLSEADRIYYQLIETQLRYRMRQPIEDTAVISECVAYYAGVQKDARKLAQAYYYRGMLEMESGKTDEAVTSLKKAEEAAQRLHDLDLRHKIYDRLSTLTFLSGNIALARK